MTPESFIAAQKRLGKSRPAFAAALCIAPNSATSCAKGRHPIPLTVRLAISALLHGLPPAC